MPTPRIKYAWSGVLERIDEICDRPVTEGSLYIFPRAQGHELAEEPARVTEGIDRALPPEEALSEREQFGVSGQWFLVSTFRRRQSKSRRLNLVCFTRHPVNLPAC